MTILIRLLIFILLGVQPIQGADFAIISDIGASAQSIGMGNIEGFSKAADTVFENPAGLYRIKNTSVSFFKTTVMEQEVLYHALSIAQKTPMGTIGFGYFETSVYDIAKTKRRITYVPVHEVDYLFDYKNSIYKLSYQRSLKPGFEIGGSFTSYQHRYYDVNGKGSNIDLGMIWHKRNRELSFLIRNIAPNSKVYYSNPNYDYEPIPTHFVLSGKLPYRTLCVYPQLKKIRSQVLPSLGLSLSPTFIPFINFLTGYKETLDYTYNRVHSWSFGMGLSLYDLQLNYAYERSDYILQDHKSYFSIAYFF